MKFAELVEELDLSAPNKAAMLSLPIEKKWQIWASRRGAAEESSTGLSSNPEDYTARLAFILNLGGYWFLEGFYDAFGEF